MGMFDNLWCEAPLPDGWVQSRPFQTKDLDCTLANVMITRAGRLLIERVEYEPNPTPPPKPDPGNLFASLAWVNSLSIEVARTWVDLDHHGFVEFYDHEPDPPDVVTTTPGRPGQVVTKAYVWHVYRAKFTDGNLVQIDLIEEHLG